MLYDIENEWVEPELGDTFKVFTKYGQTVEVKCVQGSSKNSCEDCIFCRHCDSFGDINPTAFVCAGNQRHDNIDVKFVRI